MDLNHSIVSARSELFDKNVIRYSNRQLRALRIDHKKKPIGYFYGFNLAKQTRRFDERTQWGRSKGTEFFVRRRRKSRLRCGERRRRRARHWRSLHPPQGRQPYRREEEQQANAQLQKSNSREVVTSSGNGCKTKRKQSKPQKRAKNIFLAGFNVRTLSVTTSETKKMHNEKADRLPHLIVELDASRIDICGLSEVRRCGLGSEIRDGYVLFWMAQLRRNNMV